VLDSSGGYVLAAVAAFMVGVIVTVICLRIREKNRKDGDGREGSLLKRWIAMDTGAPRAVAFCRREGIGVIVGACDKGRNLDLAAPTRAALGLTDTTKH
jgi:hypothetical protein